MGERLWLVTSNHESKVLSETLFAKLVSTLEGIHLYLQETDGTLVFINQLVVIRAGGTNRGRAAFAELR